MQPRFHGVTRAALPLAAAGLMAAAWSLGCTNVSLDSARLLGAPLFPTRAGSTATTDGATTVGGTGGFFGSGNRAVVDPCEESNTRKFVTISMRNLSQDYIHYFLMFVAFVNTDERAGAVCTDDIDLYTDNGYTFIPDGSTRAIGDYCIVGPALLRYYENGAFRGGSTSGAQFASAIPPAQGSSPAYDGFFTSSGARIPAPDWILFHNPGTGEGAPLLVGFVSANPCATLTLNFAGDCELDAFYYVDENDLLAGSTTIGAGSGRRVPNEIQGAGCVSGFQQAYGTLAPSGTTALTAEDSEFLRGGRIDFAFIREDLNPPIPQLVWRVTDASGNVVHEFDPRANIP